MEREKAISPEMLENEVMNILIGVWKKMESEPEIKIWAQNRGCPLYQFAHMYRE